MGTPTITNLGAVGTVHDVRPHSLPPEVWTSSRNVRFSENGAETVGGHKQIFGTAPVPPLWVKMFPPTSTPHWVWGNLTSMYVFTGSDHTEITRVSGPYTGTASERWHGGVVSGIGIFNNTVDAPQMWTDFDASQKLEDLSNWPAGFSCKILRPFREFLVAGNLHDGTNRLPFRIRWSHPARPGTVPISWDPADPAVDSREFDMALTTDFLVDMLPMGEVNIIYKERSTWGMRFIGAPDYFRFWPILDEEGLLARDCARSFPRGHLVATQNDIIVHNGQRQSSQSIVDRRVRRSVFNAINPSTFYNSFMVSNFPRKEIWFCYPRAGDEYATMALMWNWESGALGFRDLPEAGVPFSEGAPIGDTGGDGAIWGD